MSVPPAVVSDDSDTGTDDLELGSIVESRRALFAGGVFEGEAACLTFDLGAGECLALEGGGCPGIVLVVSVVA